MKLRYLSREREDVGVGGGWWWCVVWWWWLSFRLSVHRLSGEFAFTCHSRVMMMTYDVSVGGGGLGGDLGAIGEKTNNNHKLQISPSRIKLRQSS